MKKLLKEISILASREKVWEAIVTWSKFRIWTSVFHEGSFFEGGWKKGDRIRFLIINKNGEKEGMVSEIAESTWPEFISIRHIGFVTAGRDDTTSDDVQNWAPAYENYRLKKIAKYETLLQVEADLIDAYYELFEELWPKALEKLKGLCKE